MVFSSTVFLFIFLPVVFGLHCALPRRFRNGLLLLASLIFYAWGEPLFVLVMMASIAVNGALALCVGGAATPRRRRAFMAVSVAFNLGMLAVFKYADFIVANLNLLPFASLELPGLRLPIGISFFTFQAMSYCLDVYRGRTQAQRNIARVALYISFFPQLIAGPIVKYHEIADQIERRDVTVGGAAEGLRRFAVGLSKKLLIANVMGEAADRVFALAPAGMNAPLAWAGAAAYCLQIFFDFAGYSDMAIGLGRMFGFEFRENFNFPYVALSLRDFWRRWHISLSTWFKEYLYIPLGGNRRGLGRTCLNLSAVFLFTGLWHGAQWTFVVWGLWHGLFLMLETLGVIRAGKRFKPLSWLYTALVVAVGFVIFRAETLEQAASMIGVMFTGFRFDAGARTLLYEICSPTALAAAAAAALACAPVWPALTRRMAADPGRLRRWNMLEYAGSLLLLLLCVLSLSSATYNPFIYFRF